MNILALVDGLAALACYSGRLAVRIRKMESINGTYRGGEYTR